MRVWRIDRLTFIDKLSGIGGLQSPGRWHNRGNRIIYTASVPSLAALEYLVHLDPDIAPADISLLEIDIPDVISIESCADPATLNPNWREIHLPEELQDFGTRWLLEHRTAILSVPSAIVPMELNYLINPAHPDIARIRVVEEQPFAYDPRLLKKN
jgi:RES domain-containing protein